MPLQHGAAAGDMLVNAERNVEPTVSSGTLLCVPECPALLQSIFTLFVWIFRRLENASTPSFQMCHSILDVVSQVNSTIGVCL
jgi:hypothetical protein